jgi:hypothetical protein
VIRTGYSGRRGGVPSPRVQQRRSCCSSARHGAAGTGTAAQDQQWWGWRSRRPDVMVGGTAPGRDSQARDGAALPCQSIECPYPRAGVGTLVRGSSSEAKMSPPARRNPLERGVSPRARRNPLEGGVSPRARRNPLAGAFDWATPVGRGGHRDVGRALCVRLSKRCVLLCFLQDLSRIPPVF